MIICGDPCKTKHDEKGVFEKMLVRHKNYVDLLCPWIIKGIGSKTGNVQDGNKSAADLKLIF